MLAAYTTATTSGDDRTRTGDLSPGKRALCSAELRPLSDSAGGIRTHDLELMRLARTAAPLPRSLAGRSRTCDLRRPKPVGWPAPLQPEDEPHESSGGRARTCVSRVTVA